MKSFCIIGLGQFGRTLALTLAAEGAQVMAIDPDAEAINEIADHVTDAVIGDPQSQQFLEAAGVADYDCAVVCFGDDLNASLLSTLALKDIGVKEVIARAGSVEHRRILEKIGTDSVVFPERDAAAKLGFELARENVTDYIDFSDDYSIVTMDAPKSWIGKSLIELDVQKKNKVNVIAVRPSGSEKRQVGVSPKRPFAEGDSVTIVGLNEDTVKLARMG